MPSIKPRALRSTIAVKVQHRHRRRRERERKIERRIEDRHAPDCLLYPELASWHRDVAF